MQIFNHWESETVLFGLLLGHMLSEVALFVAYLLLTWEVGVWGRGLSLDQGFGLECLSEASPQKLAFFQRLDEMKIQFA